MKDGSRFLYPYNYALLRWNQWKISDRTFLQYLYKYNDQSDLYKKKIEIINGMRGNWDSGRTLYSYRKKERPGENRGASDCRQPPSFVILSEAF